MAKNPRVQLIVEGKDNTKNALAAISKNLTALEQRAQSTGRAMVGALAGIVSIGTLKALGQINSEWVDLSGRLRRVTADEEEFKFVTEQLGEVAENTWSGLNETVESYLSMQGPLADMGYTTKEQLTFVAALNDAMVVSGAKGEVAASVQNALNKAMAGGVLRGENLNTVIEKGGRVTEALASYLGVTVSELRALGAEGRITSDVVYEAITGSAAAFRAESEAMSATFTDALKRVKESFYGAFREEELMEPLAQSLLEFAEALKDPEVREGLKDLALALVGTASVATVALSEMGDLAVSAGFSLKQLGGTATDLEKLEHRLKQVNRSISNTGMSATLGSLTSKKELEKLKANIEGQIDLIKSGRGELFKLDKEIAQLRQRLATPVMFEDPSGNRDAQIKQLIAQKEAERKILVEQYEARKTSAEATVEVDKEAQEKALKAKREYVADMRAERDKLVSDAKKAAKKLEKDEAESLKKIEKLRKDRITIEEKYRKALAKITGASGDGEASYAGAEDLKVKAKSALSKGDIEEAKEYASAALEILEEIKEKGGNTYGFAGFVKELEAIELAANSMEIKAEEDKRKAIIVDLQELKLLASEVENINIKVDLDEAALAEVRSKLDQLSKDAVINPAIGGGSAAPQSSGPTFGKNNAASTVKVDADIEPAKQKLDKWSISVSSQSLVTPVDVETGKIREGLYRLENSFSDQPLKVPVKLAEGMHSDGVFRNEVGNSFSDKPITVPTEPDAARFEQGIRRLGDNEWTNVPPVEVPIEANIMPVGDDAEVGVRAEPVLDSVKESVDRIQAALDKYRGVIKVQTAVSDTDVGANTPGFASGGHIKGPGTGTSDSILARLSNGEYVLRAAAVKRYGTRLLDDINGLRLPKFADGGLVDRVSNIAPQAKSIGSLNFHLPGGDSFSVDVAGTSSLDDLHRAALKYGRTRK